MLCPSPEISTSAFGPRKDAYVARTLAGGTTVSPSAPMSITGLVDGVPVGPTGAQPTAVLTDGAASALKAVPPPAEWPTAATSFGSATPDSGDDGSAEACSTAVSDDVMMAESWAAVGVAVSLSAWAARPRSR